MDEERRTVEQVDKGSEEDTSAEEEPEDQIIGHTGSIKPMSSSRKRRAVSTILEFFDPTVTNKSDHPPLGDLQRRGTLIEVEVPSQPQCGPAVRMRCAVMGMKTIRNQRKSGES